MIDTAFEYLQEIATSTEVLYLLLIFGLFLLPRILIRFGIPFAVTSFLLGVASSSLMRKGLFETDVIRIFSFLGITSLFLFAGLEVDVRELREKRNIIIEHVVVQTLLILAAGYILLEYLGISYSLSALVALAIMTPSTGFILDSIEHSPLSDSVKLWIRTKAIAAEIVALALMFFFVKVKVGSILSLTVSSLILVGLIVVLPSIFRFFKNRIDPFAPQSEFSFLLLVSLVFALVTKKLGAYYLIGAFVVGIVARRIEATQPKLSSKSMLKSLKTFTSFFIPFYFFYSGSLVKLEAMDYRSLALAVVLVAILVPARVLSVVLHRKLSIGEAVAMSFPVATFLLPNLVFGLVIVDILREFKAVPEHILGALVIYTLIVTVIPSLALKFFAKDDHYFDLASQEGTSFQEEG